VKRFRVAYKAPGRPSRALTIDGSLEAMKALVGGYLELVRLEVMLAPAGKPALLDLWCNEDGIGLGLRPNVRLPVHGVIVGAVFVAARDGEETIGLTSEQLSGALSALDRAAVG
jgi:hypothetical protein